jgi:hypothetical protein
MLLRTFQTLKRHILMFSHATKPGKNGPRLHTGLFGHHTNYIPKCLLAKIGNARIFTITSAELGWLHQLVKSKTQTGQHHVYMARDT